MHSPLRLGGQQKHLHDWRLAFQDVRESEVCAENPAIVQTVLKLNTRKCLCMDLLWTIGCQDDVAVPPPNHPSHTNTDHCRVLWLH